MSSDLILVGWFDEDLLEAAPTGIQVGVDGKAAIDFALGLTRDSMTNVDALSSLMTDRFASQDWLIASARDNLLSIDFLLTVNRDGRIDIDWQGAVSILRDGNSPVDWMTFFDKVNASGIDWRIELGRDSGNSIDVLFGNGRGLQTAADFLSALQKDLGVPISWQMTVTFDASPASVDWRVLTDTLLLSRLDWRLLLGTDGALSIGVLSMGGVDARGALDFLSTLQRSGLE